MIHRPARQARFHRPLVTLSLHWFNSCSRRSLLFALAFGFRWRRKNTRTPRSIKILSLSIFVCLNHVLARIDRFSRSRVWRETDYWWCLFFFSLLFVLNTLTWTFIDFLFATFFSSSSSCSSSCCCCWWCCCCTFKNGTWKRLLFDIIPAVKCESARSSIPVLSSFRPVFLMNKNEPNQFSLVNLCRWSVLFSMTVIQKTTSHQSIFAFALLEAFQDFLGDDFDIKSFSATVLQTKIVTDYLLDLNELVRTLDAEIKQQVEDWSSTSFDSHLFFRSRRMHRSFSDKLRPLEQSKMSWKTCNHASARWKPPWTGLTWCFVIRRKRMRSSISLFRISSKITEPYNKILVRKYQLTRLQVNIDSLSLRWSPWVCSQNTCDLLRRIKGIMQQTKKLQSYMSTNNAGQQQMELVKASQCLSELGKQHFLIEAVFYDRRSLFCSDHFTVDADFTGIDAVEKDLQFVFKARHDIQSQAQDVLENGLNHLVS
jgi:hypothetical protein